MARTKFSFQRIKFAKALAAIALVFVSFINCSKVVQAQSQPESSVRFVKPTLARRGAPPSGRQTGSASRGECSVVSQPLTALVPTTQETLRQTNQGDDPELSRWESVLGLTTSQTPSLWFYNPYSAKLPIQFVLQDERGNYIYKSYFATSQTQPGIVKLSFPKAVSLKVGQRYQWYFSVSCDSKNTAFVKGWIQPVALSSTLANRLKKVNPQQRVALYAANGIWYDALTLLAELRTANPKDAKLLNDWVSLLNSVGLEAIAQKPINKSEIMPTPTVSRMGKGRNILSVTSFLGCKEAHCL